MSKVGIVLLYGLYTPEKKDYRGYLEFVASEIGTRGLDRVILCGGFTDREQPNSSEAATAR